MVEGKALYRNAVELAAAQKVSDLFEGKDNKEIHNKTGITAYRLDILRQRREVPTIGELLVIADAYELGISSFWAGSEKYSPDKNLTNYKE